MTTLAGFHCPELQQMPVRAALGNRENPALHVGLFANVEAQKTGHGLRETELEPDKWIFLELIFSSELYVKA